MLTPKCSPLIERPALAAASSITTRPAAASSGVHSHGSQPSDNRRHSSRGAARATDGRGPRGGRLRVGVGGGGAGGASGCPPLPACPQTPQEWQRLVDERA